MGQEPTISVKGVGNVSLPPDMTVITFEMSSQNRVYSASVEQLNERVATLREKLSGVGIDPKQLKTSRFRVDAEHRYSDGRHIFIGWKARHDLRLELPVDREQLNRAFEAVTTEEIQAELRVHFAVRDEAAVRDAVLAEATRQARRNAETIASAARCSLGRVLKMEYGWAELRVRSVEYSMMMEAETRPTALAAPDIEPEDVEAGDSVTVVWELLET